MPIPTVIGDLSTTASLNSPAGSENLSTTDDYLRAVQGIVKTVYNDQVTINGTIAAKANLTTNTFTDVQTLASGAALNTSISTLASSATPDIWTGTSNVINYTGAVTATGFAAAPQAGVARTLILASTASFTAGTNMLIDGVVSFTGAAGDEVAVFAVTTTQFRLRPKLASGTAVIASAFASSAEYVTGTDTAKALNSATARARNIVAGTAVASISGTSIDFTGIPIWAKQITIMLNGVSTNGSSSLLVQIGAGSNVSTGYNSSGTRLAGTLIQQTSSTTGFIFNTAASSAVVSGQLVIVLLGNNIYTAFGGVADTTGSVNYINSGGITLSGILDRLRLTTVNGTDIFDAGSVNILYE